MTDCIPILRQAVEIIGYVSSIAAFAVLLIKPLRNRIFGICDIKDGVKCLLRSDMLATYYKNHENDSMRQHERENLEAVYKAYKALGGNSFIDSIYREMAQWEVLT